MVRICALLFVLSLVLAACGDPYSHVEPDAAFDQSRDAIGDGDARTALALLKSAADRGHLHALDYLADSYDRGYFTVQAADRPATHNLTFRKWPWEAARWRRAFETELEQRVAAGDADALMLHADHLRSRVFRDGEWHDPEQADLDEADAILRGLAGSGNATAMIHLGFYSREDDRREWLRRAEEAGEPSGCWFQFFFYDAGARMITAADFAVAIDRAEECHAMDPEHHFDFAADRIGDLRTQVERGNGLAVAHLDSLQALGVFERHPRLRELL